MLNIMLKILLAEFQINGKIFFPENAVKQLSALNVINVCCGGVTESNLQCLSNQVPKCLKCLNAQVLKFPSTLCTQMYSSAQVSRYLCLNTPQLWLKYSTALQKFPKFSKSAKCLNPAISNSRVSKSPIVQSVMFILYSVIFLIAQTFKKKEVWNHSVLQFTQKRHNGKYKPI